MAAWRPILRSALPALAVAAGVALVLGLVYRPWYLNYDSRYALLWARDLSRGLQPEYGAAFAPTPHPLWTFVALLLLPLGRHADVAMAAVVLLSFGGLIWLLYRLGATLLGPAAGVLAGAVVLTRYAFERDVVLAYLDVPFATLIAAAVVLEAQRPRRGTAVLVVLAVAGLLRPEAWVLTGAYVLWLWPRLDARGRARALALAALGPAVWLGSDAIITGDPLHSLNGTAEVAIANDRRRTLGDVPYWTVQYFGYTLRVGVLVGILAGLGFAWRRGLRRWALPLAASVVLVAVFAGGPVFGLPLIGRYIRTPSALLSVYFGIAVVGWRALAPSRARTRWAVVGAAVLLLGLASLPGSLRRLGDLSQRRDRDAQLYGDLRALARRPAVRSAFARCGHVTAGDHRPVPYFRWWVGGNPGSVGTAERERLRPGALLLLPRRTPVPLRFYGPEFPRVPAPPGYVRLAATRSWKLLGPPGCRA